MSLNPNSAEALRYRDSELEIAHRSPVESRLAYLVELTAASECSMRAWSITSWRGTPHRRNFTPPLRELQRSVLVLTSSKAALPPSRESGYDVRLADITAPGLEEVVGKKYDIVIAGELIEHIESPGQLLDNARAVLANDGLLVLTTPNPYCLRLIGDHVRGKVRENVDHLMYYFPSGIAELSSRHGWVLASYRGAREPRSAMSLRRRVARVAEKMLSEDVSCWTFIYELHPS